MLWKDGQHKLIATEDLLPGTLIPILGALTGHNARPYSKHSTHLYRNGHLSRFLVDGHPSIDQYENTGSNGLAIAMMANEPERTSAATASFDNDYLRIIKHLPKGDEITVEYAQSADMVGFRTTQGYSVIRDRDPLRQPSAYPTAEHLTRRFYTTKWYPNCNQRTSIPRTPRLTPYPNHGMVNIGQTCYLSAAVQALLEEHSTAPDGSHSRPIPANYSELIRILTHPESTNKHNQEEAIRKLMHECNKTRGHGSILQVGRQSSVAHMFDDLLSLGPYREWAKTILCLTEFQCRECHHTHGTALFTHTALVTVPQEWGARTTVTLRECIQESEKSRPAPSEYRCAGCAGSQLTMTEKFRPMTDFLPITLIRSPYHGTRSQTSVVPPIHNFRYHDKANQLRLTSIIRHEGPDYNSGHCTTIARRNGQWHLFNDEVVSPLDERFISGGHEEVLGGREQILIYSNPATSRPQKPNNSTRCIQPAQEHPNNPPPPLPQPRSSPDPWPVPALMEEIVRFRRSTLSRTDIGHAEVIGPTTTSICTEYTADTYSKMNADSIKLLTYKQGIAAATKGDHILHVDLGCGAYATQTKEVLTHHKKCLALEINPEAINMARKTLQNFTYQRPNLKWDIIPIHASFLNQALIRDACARWGDPMPTTIRVVHEIFGFLASSEGAPMVLRAMRRSLGQNFRVEFAPRYAASLLVPTEIKAEDIPSGKDTLAKTQIANPQLILARRVNIKRAQLADKHHTLEQFDFDMAADDVNTARIHNHTTITIEKAGTLNSLVGFLSVDFGRDYQPRRGSAQSSTPGALNSGPSFTSVQGDKAYATNWQNPIFLLQRPVRVEVGDIILIESSADVFTEKPSYSITIGKAGDPSPETIRIEYHAMYPTYRQLPPTPADAEEDQSRPYSKETTWTTPPPPAPCPPAELYRPNPTGGGPPRRRRVTAKRKVVPRGIERDLSTTFTKEIGQGPSMMALVNILMKEHGVLRNTPANRPFFCPEVEEVVASHLHLSATANTHLSHVRIASTWHSPHPPHATIGAHTGGLSPFLRNRMTWVNPREQQTDTAIAQLFTDIVRGVNDSTRARVVGLFATSEETIRANVATMLLPPTRMCILASFKPHTIPTHHIRTSDFTTLMDIRKNETTLHLVLIERGDLNPIDTATLQGDLQTHAPGVQINIPWHPPSRNFTRSTIRTLPTLRPTLAFLHSPHALIAPGSNKSRIETHSRVAGALGILPSDMERQMRYHRHGMTNEGLTRDQVHDLTQLIRSTISKVYERYLKWNTINKYGAA